MTISTVISVIFNQYDRLFWADLSQIFAIWLQTPRSNRMTKGTFLSRNKSSLRAVNSQNITLCLRSSYGPVVTVRVTPIDRLLTIHKCAVISIFLHFVHGRYRTARSWNWEWVEMVNWNGPFRSDRSNREKWSTSKGGSVFSKLPRLDRTNPFTLRPKFPEISVEWIAP